MKIHGDKVPDDLAAQRLLIAKVLEGDEIAVRELLRLVYPLVQRICQSYRSKWMETEDLVQSALSTVFTKLQSFRSQAPFEHWVARLAVNSCRKHLRYERVRPEESVGEQNEGIAHSVALYAQSSDASPGEKDFLALDLLQKLLAAIEPEERHLITLLHIEEKSTRDIAQIMGWSRATVKVKAFRARQKLKNLLNLHLQNNRYEPRPNQY